MTLGQFDRDFARFMREVDVTLEQTGVSADDLPDASWRDYYEDGLNPTQAVRTAIEDGLFE